MADEEFSIKDIGITLAKMLNLSHGDTVEFARSKIDSNKILVTKHASESKESADAK